MTPKQIQHLYWRAAFGISPSRSIQLSENNRRELVNQVFDQAKNYNPLQIDLSEFDGMKSLLMRPNKSTIVKFFKKSTEKLKEFNIYWVGRMLDEPESLRERMVLFWANHFVCRDNNIWFVQQYNNTLRKHALGHFGDFVKAISREPAMLKYLNNKQNVKSSPNENFARELMELFMLGTGQYSEKDIKESARAFTGYFHDFEGRFLLRQRRHDRGLKEFMGEQGYFNGDDIIDIILSRKSCAEFICRKIYKYFVNESVDEHHIEEMVKVFYPSYQIDELMRFVFNTDWFYDEKNIGTKIKSPIEFIIGLNNIVPLKFNKPKQLLILQQLTGQVLLNPPNVAGWEGGRRWIDVNTLLLRLKLPSLLLNDGYIASDKHNELPDSLIKRIRNKLKSRNRFDISVNWHDFDEEFENISYESMPELLIQPEIMDDIKEMIDDISQISKREFCIQLMSLPEYQMC